MYAQISDVGSSHRQAHNHESARHLERSTSVFSEASHPYDYHPELQISIQEC